MEIKKSDKRVFCGSIRVKLDTEKYNFELADASLYDGEEGKGLLRRTQVKMQ